MKQKVLSLIDMYIEKIKGVEIPLAKIRVDIFESYVLKKRMSDNPRDDAYEDYAVSFTQPFTWVQDYVRDFFALDYKKTLISCSHWGNIYGPLEQSRNRSNADPVNFSKTADYTYVYGVDVQPDSCELVIEYDDNRRKKNTWHIPLETNKFILFPSTQRYFISKNKGCEMNVFLTVNSEYIRKTDEPLYEP